MSATTGATSAAGTSAAETSAAETSGASSARRSAAVGKTASSGGVVELDGGVRLAYRAAGHGPPLVLVHGLGGSGGWWARNVQTLSRHHRVHLVDLVGFGASAGQVFLLHDAARHLVAWMDAVGLDRATFVGHSMGGAIAAELAADHPERVERLVLLDAAGLPFPSGYIRHAVHLLRTLPQVPLGLLVAAAFDAVRVGPISLARAAHQILASDLTPKLSRIRAPTLVIWGSRDRLIPLATGRRLASLIPDARLVVFDGAGHTGMWERPEGFERLVRDFVAEPTRATPGTAGAPSRELAATVATLPGVGNDQDGRRDAPSPGRGVYLPVGDLAMHVRTGAAIPARTRPVVVLVHGLVISSRSMVPTLQRLAARYPTYAPDLPGFGWTSRPPTVLDVPGHAGAVVRFLDALGVERAVMVGSSFGSQVVADVAARYPDRVERVVLTGPTFDPHVRSLAGHLARLLMDAPLERLSLWLHYLPDHVLAGVPRALATLRFALRDSIETKLPRIQAPTLVVRGSRDPIVPRAWAAEAAALLPDGRLVELPGGPHAVNHSSPDLLVEAIEDFLDELPGGSGADRAVSRVAGG